MQPSATADSAPTSGASRWIIVVAALAGVAAGLVAFGFTTPSYETQVVVDVSNPAGPISDEIAVVQSDAVIGVAESLVGFRPDISVTAAEVAGSLTITAKASDAQQAAAAANAVAGTYVQAQSGVAASIAEPAAIPDSRSGLGRPLFALIGGLIGALLGFFIGSVQGSQSDKPNGMQSRAGRPGQPPAGSPGSEFTPDAPSISPIATSNVHPSADAAMGSLPPSSMSAPIMPSPASTPPSSLWASVSTSRPSPSAEAAAALPAAVSPPAAEPPAARPPVSPPSFTPPPVPASPARTSTTTGSMTSRPSSFSDAAKSDSDDQLSWLNDASATAATTQLSNLGRRAMQSQHEAERYELVLSHAQEIAHITAEHERATIDLRNEVAALTKKTRVQETRLKSQVGNNQTRAGDLEAQVDALEVELATIRQTLESERIAHTRRITEDRNAADRALDNARREYRDELGKHGHAHRQTIADHRVELDAELASDRARHAAALEAAHADYERQLESERAKTEARLVAANEQHERDADNLRKANRHELDRQSAQHKVTITQLRTTTEHNEAKLRDLEKENRLLRVEVSTQQKRAHHSETELATAAQRASDELALVTAELEGERERNVALRADVLRRSAEAHQAIDKAVEERTAQLSELEASVARQRQYADTRVREISAAAEEQSRQAASREASLTATISRLNRELEEAKRQS